MVLNLQKRLKTTNSSKNTKKKNIKNKKNIKKNKKKSIKKYNGGSATEIKKKEDNPLEQHIQWAMSSTHPSSNAENYSGGIPANNNADEIEISIESNFDNEKKIKVIKNTMIYDEIAKSFNLSPLDIKISFGNDEVSHNELFSDRGIDDGARLYVYLIPPIPPGEILIGKEFMSPRLPNGKRRIIVNREGVIPAAGYWTGDVYFSYDNEPLWFFGHALDENGNLCSAPTYHPPEYFQHKRFLNATRAIMRMPSPTYKGPDYIRLETYSRNEPGIGRVVANDNNLIHEALIQNGWIARQISEYGELLPPSREAPSGKNYRVHYIHESLLGLEVNDSDEYWQCKVTEGDNYEPWESNGPPPGLHRTLTTAPPGYVHTYNHEKRNPHRHRRAE